MTTNLTTVAATTTCKDCAAPIAPPARGRRKVFCEACRVQRKKLRDNAPRQRTPAQREAKAQAKRERYAASPEKRAKQAQWDAKRYAARTSEEIATYAQYQREYKLQSKYGIGVGEHDVLLAAQAGRCAICGTAAPNGRRLCVDHDHVTGQVRGVLCHGCNVGIGFLKDDPAILRAAVAYLERT